MPTRDKEDYRILIESMEDVLDVIEKYIEKGHEGIEKLTKALEEADVLLKSFGDLRNEMKESWRNAEE